MNQDQLKLSVAQAAIDYVIPKLQPNDVLGIGTGSTANFFIDLLAPHKHKFAKAVSSSEMSSARLRQHGIQVVDLNDVKGIRFYVDGADEVNAKLELIKGGGGALTREKIVAAASECFVCIVDASKQVDVLGSFPLPIEVIPMARESICQRIQAIGGDAKLRQAFVTDNGNQILDVHGLNIENGLELEQRINQWPGVVTNGVFGLQKADVLLTGTAQGVDCIECHD